MLHDFELVGQRMRLWQRPGESYEHVLMKALGFAMFIDKFPALEIERTVGLRYKPDLVAQNENGEFLFWGECGANSIRKTNWLLKHARVECLVLFKIGQNVRQLIEQLREGVAPRYRGDNRLSLVNFIGDIVQLTANRRINCVPNSWYTEVSI